MPSKIVLDAVRERQASGWTTAPVYYPNDVVVPAPGLVAFVQAEFPVGAGAVLTLDRLLHDESGTIRFIIHVPLKTGADLAFQYADELGTLFDSVRLLTTSKLSLQTDAAGPAAGLGADGAYSLTSVVIPYRCLFMP